MSHHLGYSPGAVKPAAVTNQRNGTGAKTVLTEDGPIRIEVPRDRDGSFEPLLIPKHERRFTGFDDKIVAMYARGMTVREIQGFLQEQYGTEVSPDFISSVTDEVMVEVTTWQARPLEPMYPVVFFDALRVKIREDAVVRNKAVYLALGVLPDGTRDILGLWIESTEGAKFWMKVFNDLKTRGVNDILIAVTDGLKGMPEALAAVFPATTLQTCIVHLIRNSLATRAGKTADRWLPRFARSIPHRVQKPLKLSWTPLPKGRGGRNSRPSVPLGATPGIV
jgi:transposase-like protein